MKEIEQKRILWIDIYKALAIILVVVGHATGKYNVYIYQFHLAAFFLISGYVTKQKNLSIVQIFAEKIYSTLWPLFILVIINASIMSILTRIGQYDFWFGEYNYIGIGNILREFFLNGSIYTWWLGAGWFLVVLFFVYLISKILYELANKVLWKYFIYSVIVYIMGYYLINKLEFALPYSLDLALVAQFYFCLGYIVKQKMGNRLQKINIILTCVIFLISSIIMKGLGEVSGVNIDYASRSFSNIYLNTITSINGIISLFVFSQILQTCKIEKIIKLLRKIGENTLGVLLLHFIAFKLSYIILYFLNVMRKEEIALITPNYEIGCKYWWLITILSIAVCVCVWDKIKNNKCLATLFGLDKVTQKKIGGQYKKSRLYNNYIVVVEDDRILKKINKVREIVSNIIFAIVLIGVLVWGCDVLVAGYKKIDLTFPNTKYNIQLSDGWLEQGTEDYRWIQDEGTIRIDTNLSEKIIMEGYVPEHFAEVNKLDIYVNGELMESIDVKKEPAFIKEYDINHLDKKGYIEIKFDFDGEHKPDEGTGEVRILSGFIKRVSIQ